jgi:hypothetical protein
MTRGFVIALLLIFTILIILLHTDMARTYAESFADRSSKATAIYDWFAANPRPNYEKFRKDLGYESNVVEYEDALVVSQTPNFTKESVENIL